MRGFVVVVLTALLAACAEKEPPRVEGRMLLKAKAHELWSAPGGEVVATLADAAPSDEKGAPADVLLGSLTLVPVGGGAERRLGDKVSNLPGSLLFSADGGHVAFVAGYSVTNAHGELRLAKTAGTAAPEVLGTGVTFFAFSPKGDALAWVSDGKLFVRPVAGGEAKAIAEGVSLVQFGPAGTPAEGRMLVKRTIRVDGALLSYDLAAGKLTALARGVGAFGWAPGGDALAFQATGLLPATAVEPPSKFGKQPALPDEAPGLYLQLGTGAPKRVSAEGATEFRFSPDGQKLAFLTPAQGAKSAGDLYVADRSGAPARVATRVAQFLFTPDGTIALLGAYDRSASAGTLGLYTTEGALVEIARSVRQFSVTPKGKWLVFLHGVVKNTIYSLALSVHRLGAKDEKPRELDTGVSGYLVDESEEHLAYKARCIDEGKTCTLFLANLAKTEPAVILAARVGAFEFVPGGEGLVIVSSRPVAKLSRELLFTLGTVPETVPEGAKVAPVTVLDDHVEGEFAITGPDRRKVVYLVDEKERAGVGVVPLGGAPAGSAAQ